MTEHRRRKGAGYVTNATIFVSWQMRWVGFVILASRTWATIDVAGITPGVKHLGTGVVDIGVGKISGVMTHTAIFSGNRMRWRRSFASGINHLETSIMAGTTVTGNTRVIKVGCGRERGIRMAKVAILPCWQMIRGFDKSSGKESADMTTFTATSNIWMNRANKLRR